MSAIEPHLTDADALKASEGMASAVQAIDTLAATVPAIATAAKEKGGWVEPAARPVALASPSAAPAGILSNFASAGSMPYGFRNAMVTNARGTAYVIGGLVGPTATDSILTAPINEDGTLGTWAKSSARLVTARAGFSQQAQVIGNYLYVFGGFYTSNGNQIPLGTVERAPLNGDGSLGAFSTVSGIDLVTAKSFFTTLVTGPYVYAIGSPTGNSGAATVERAPVRADGSLGAFATVAGVTLKTPRMDHASVRIGNALYVLGGCTPNWAGLTSVEKATVNADGTLGDFATVSGVTLSSVRFGQQPVMTNGRLYLVGGYFNGFLTTVESAPVTGTTLGTFANEGGITLNPGLSDTSVIQAGKSVFLLGGQTTGGAAVAVIQKATIQ